MRAMWLLGTTAMVLCGIATVPQGATAQVAVAAVPLECRARESCCKICDKGMACGNSCISRTKTCHRGAGCACDASDVCR